MPRISYMMGHHGRWEMQLMILSSQVCRWYFDAFIRHNERCGFLVLCVFSLSLSDILKMNNSKYIIQKSMTNTESTPEDSLFKPSEVPCPSSTSSTSASSASISKIQSQRIENIIRRIQREKVRSSLFVRTLMSDTLYRDIQTGRTGS